MKIYYTNKYCLFCNDLDHTVTLYFQCLFDDQIMEKLYNVDI